MGYKAQVISGPLMVRSPLPPASSRTLLNAHRLPRASPGSRLGQAAWAKMRVRLSIIHAPAPLASPAWLAVNISQVSVGRDARQRLQDRNAGSFLSPRAPDQTLVGMSPAPCLRLDQARLVFSVGGYSVGLYPP